MCDFQVWRKNQVLNPAVGDSVTLPRSCCSSVVEGGHCVGGQPEVGDGGDGGDGANVHHCSL